jgi:glutamate synthase domain-containing protein 2
VGFPFLGTIPKAVQALQEKGMHRKVQLIVSRGIRNGTDEAKAMALTVEAAAMARVPLAGTTWIPGQQY